MLSMGRFWSLTMDRGDPTAAELGAAFLCAHLELATEPREENASYIANWPEVLKNDMCFIFKAAANAQRAADYLRAFNGADAATTTDAEDDAEARAA
jgi:antirestriction protein ArdC